MDINLTQSIAINSIHIDISLTYRYRSSTRVEQNRGQPAGRQPCSGSFLRAVITCVLCIFRSVCAVNGNSYVADF